MLRYRPAPHAIIRAGMSTTAWGRVPAGRLTALVSEFRGYDGVDLVQLGPVSTAALKGIIRLSSSEDPDVKHALKLIKANFFNNKEKVLVQKNTEKKEEEKSLF